MPRVTSLVREAVAEILLGGVKDPRIGGVVITDAELTGDLREATIFYYVHGDEGARAEAAEGLARCAGFVRRELGQRVSLRVVPSVQFRFDRSLDEGARIEARLRALGLGSARPRPEGAAMADEQDERQLEANPFDAEEATEPGTRLHPELEAAVAAAADDDADFDGLDDPTPAHAEDEFEEEDHTEPGRAGRGATEGGRGSGEGSDA